MIEIDPLFSIFLAKKFPCLGSATKMLLKCGEESFERNVFQGCKGTPKDVWGTPGVCWVATHEKWKSELTLRPSWLCLYFHRKTSEYGLCHAFQINNPGYPQGIFGNGFFLHFSKELPDCLFQAFFRFFSFEKNNNFFSPLHNKK